MKILLQEEIASTHASHLKKHEATDYAAMMGIIFSMVKQDYVMQVMSFPLFHILDWK